MDKAGNLFYQGTNGSTIILIHGLTGSPRETAYLAIYLNRKGFTVVCPRLAKHGQPMDIFRKAKWQEFYASVRKVFLEREAAGDQSIFVSGLSVGALLALLLADEFKDRVKGVSCLSPILFFDGWNATKWRYLLPLGFYTPLKYYIFFKEEHPYGVKNEAVRERIHAYYHQRTVNDMGDVTKNGYPFYPIALLYQHYLLVKYLKTRIPFIQSPLQIIQAREDDMSSVKNAYAIRDTIASKIKEIVLLEDSYHVIVADQEREKVAAELDRFFSSLSSH
ncbi:MAG: alpha/beta fold hydrolase [Candidatus Omnitrophica bacterium]|nr:alpha/beta fold hydrolase [Candidatus Omnitrophota bacterium]